jgi:hypothetical protein
MAKVTGPLLSLDASGSVASVITFSRWKGINYVRQRVIPTYSNTFKQVAIREVIKQATQAWAGLGITLQTAYNEAASGMGMSGFNLFVRDAVGKNYDATTSPYFDGTLVEPTSVGDNQP